MPSVGMRRRTTRIFGARVLRSGRQLWIEQQGQTKKPKLANKESWIELLDDSSHRGSDAKVCKKNKLCSADVDFESQIDGMDIDESLDGCKSGNSDCDLLVGDPDEERMYSSVYHRKRKSMDPTSQNISGLDETGNAVEDRKYGKQYSRQLSRKRTRESSEAKMAYAQHGAAQSKAIGVAIVKRNSCCNSAEFSWLLSLILKYMRAWKLRLSRLLAFLLSEPITHVYSSFGIQFQQDTTCDRNVGVCCISGVRSYIPLFTVNFSAIPYCFKFMHSSLHLSQLGLSYIITSSNNWTHDEDTQSCDEYESMVWTSRKVELNHSHSENDRSGTRSVATRNYKPVNRRASRLTLVTPRRSIRVMQLRNGVNSRRGQRRCNSMSLRLARNSSVFGARKAKGSSVSDCLSSRHDSMSVPLASSYRIKNSVQRRSNSDIKEAGSTLVDLTYDVESAGCLANLLIIESDRCYREVGVNILLEVFAGSKQWSLVVQREGITRYSLKPQKNIRPYSCNRFTRTIIWTVDNGWKLEFSGRKEWLVFKELYQECFNRNVQLPAVGVIPVPIVREAQSYQDSSFPFIRPDSYISVKVDEVSRALAKRTANYDMDLDDEEWINKFNTVSSEGKKTVNLSAEKFELIIDAFEKGFYCSPDDFSEIKAAVNLCSDLESREVLEAVHGYWMKKRRQKGLALVKIFQCYQQRRAQVFPISVLRKKRSFKRQARQIGKGTQQSFLQVVVAEQDALDEKKEARVAATRLEALAITKRQRAQLLLEKADLATYKATMALRIAEAARVVESSGVAASFLLA